MCLWLRQRKLSLEGGNYLYHTLGQKAANRIIVTNKVQIAMMTRREKRTFGLIKKLTFRGGPVGIDYRAVVDYGQGSV